MKKNSLLPLALLSAAAIGSSHAATFDLFEYAFNIDGTISDSLVPDPTPGGVNVAGFDPATGLGTIQFTMSGAGSHYFSTYYDHEIDEAVNTFFNEIGAKHGTPGAGRSWEIDEPGFSFGNIFSNFTGGALDNTVGTASPDDVSMALGWSFNLGAYDTAKITLLTSDTAPTSGFYLEQTDPDSQASVYLSGSLNIVTQSPNPSGVPETGNSGALLAFGLTGLFTARRVLSRKPSAKI